MTEEERESMESLLLSIGKDHNLASGWLSDKRPTTIVAILFKCKESQTSFAAIPLSIDDIVVGDLLSFRPTDVIGFVEKYKSFIGIGIDPNDAFVDLFEKMKSIVERYIR